MYKVYEIISTNNIENTKRYEICEQYVYFPSVGIVIYNIR